MRRLGDLARAAGFGSGGDVVVDAELAVLAETEEAAPFLGGRLLARELAVADAPTGAALARAYRVCLARNVVADEALRSLRAALQARGVPALLWKGAALVRSVYPSPGLRPMWDADVLVPADRADEACAAAEETGGRRHRLAGRPLTQRHDYARAFLLAPGVLVEIHRYLCARPLFAVDYPGLFARSQAAPDGWLVPDDDDHFVLLGLHAAKHGFAVPFRAVLDGLLLAARASAAAVVERALAWRGRTAVAAWLELLARFGLPDSPWRDSRAALGRARLGRGLTEGAPWPPDAAAGLGWRRHARVAFSVEPARALAWVGQRAAFRLLDALARLGGDA